MKLAKGGMQHQKSEAMFYGEVKRSCVRPSHYLPLLKRTGISVSGCPEQPVELSVLF